jgi:hypothetical protein
MEELQADDVIRMVLKKQETCSIRDINEFKDKYNKKHPFVYVDVCRDNIEYVRQAYRTEFYWNNEKGYFIKQESIKCPVCGDIHYKYPDESTFQRIVVINMYNVF